MMGVWEDNRIGGYPRLRHCDERDLMQVPDELRKCVCFLEASTGEDGSDSTGFFVAVDIGLSRNAGGPREAVYIVTAGHCVAIKGELAERITVRLNTRDGGSATFDTDPAGWMVHPVADVAVYAVAPDRGIYDYLYYPAHSAATEEFIKENRIGPGDEVLITGLLIYHPGETQILPIVRVGSIAAFPPEPINMITGEDRAYLAEVRSLGGLSGSPAFLHMSDFRRDEEGNLRVQRGQWSGAGPNYLLGVVHGFFATQENDPDNLVEDLNAGITVVVPIDRVLDLIDGPELTAQREQLRISMEGKAKPTPATATVQRSNAAPEFDRFQDLTRRLLAVPKSEVDALREKERGGLTGDEA